jgi:hypothetical protein
MTCIRAPLLLSPLMLQTWASALELKNANAARAPVANEPLHRGLLDGAIILFHVLQEVAAVLFIGSAALIRDENSALTLKRHCRVVERKVTGRKGGRGRGGGGGGVGVGGCGCAEKRKLDDAAQKAHSKLLKRSGRGLQPRQRDDGFDCCGRDRWMDEGIGE